MENKPPVGYEKVYVREENGDYLLLPIYYDERHRNNKGLGYPPKLKEILVGMIGKENYSRMDNMTKVVLLREMLEQFKSEQIAKYGSFYKYLQDWCRKNGFRNVKEYHDSLYQMQGYKDRKDFLKKQAKEQGYKKVWHRRFEKYKNKINAQRSVDVVNYWAKKKGFNDWFEYQNFLAQKNGYEDRNHYRRSKSKNKEVKIT